MESLTTRMLVIDDDKNFVSQLRRELPQDYRVENSSNDENAIKVFRDFSPHVVIVNNDSAKGSYIDLLVRFKEIDRNVIRIIVADQDKGDEHIMDGVNRADIHGYFKKPVPFEVLKQIIRQKTINYHIVKAFQVDPGKSEEAYRKLKTIFDEMDQLKLIKKEGEMLIRRANEAETKTLSLLDSFVERFKKETESQARLLGELGKKVEIDDKERLKARDLSQEMFRVVKDDLVKDLVEIKTQLVGLVKQKGEIDEHKSQHERESAMISQNLAEYKMYQEQIRLSAEKERSGMMQEIEAERDTARRGIAEEQEKIDRLSKEMEGLRVAAIRERNQMVEEFENKKKALEKQIEDERIAIKRAREEAENYIELQKKKNEKELAELQESFEEEKRKAAIEVKKQREVLEQQLEDEREAIKKARAEAEDFIALQKKKNEKELEAMQLSFAEEKRKSDAKLEEQRLAMKKEAEEQKRALEEQNVKMQADFKAQKDQLEKDLADQKDALEKEIERIKTETANKRELMEKELQEELDRKRKEVEEELAKQKAALLADLDRIKAEAEKRARDAEAKMMQVARIAKEAQDEGALYKTRAAEAEKEGLKYKGEMEKIKKETEAMRSEYEFAVRSREALEAEIAELKSR